MDLRREWKVTDSLGKVTLGKRLLTGEVGTFIALMAVMMTWSFPQVDGVSHESFASLNQ